MNESDRTALRQNAKRCGYMAMADIIGALAYDLNVVAFKFRIPLVILIP